jgi:hypothetical protein
MADQVIQRVFTGGEISPALHARADTNTYQSGLALCQNFFVRSQGGAYSRQGTKYIAAQGDSTKRGRLIPFSFNTTQTYVLVVEENAIRVIRDGGYVLTGFTPYTITTTYTEAQLSRLIFTQDADVMTITHPDHDPKYLSRIAHDNWTFANVNFAGTVAIPGSVVIATVGTASGAANKDYSYIVTAIVGGKESLPSAMVTHNINALSVTYGSRVSWAAVADAEYYRVYRDPSDGTGIYAWIGDTETRAFEDFNVLPDTSDGPPSDYLPFATANNKPSTVGYYQQRQIFANTTNEPQKVFATQSGDYDSMRFSRPLRANDSIFATLKATKVNEIRHVVGLDALFLLTSGAEWIVTEGQDQVLTPGSVGFRPYSYWGSSWTAPALVGDSVIFVQEKGARIRDLFKEVNAASYQGNDLSVMAQHLFDGHEILEMTYAQEPYGILWCIRDDGVLLGMTYQKEHGIWGWHQHVTDGTYESVTSISEDGRDAVYVIVNRTIEGVTKRYIERFEKRYDDAPENVWCVDSGLQYDSTPARVFSGLDHLEAETVVAVADGVVVKDLIVASGAVTLPRAASKVTIGLPYNCAIETLEIDMASLKQSWFGKEVSVSTVKLKLEKSRGGFVGNVAGLNETQTTQEIKPRTQSDGYDAISLKTHEQEVTVPAEWGAGGALRIEQNTPMPMSILAVIPNVDVS